MPIYRVTFVETVGNTTFSSHLNVKVPSEEAAETQAKQTQRQLARKYRKGPIDIQILSITKLGSENEQILDLLWDMYPDAYLELWEPDITTEEIIKDLKKKYPKIYKLLT